MKAFATALFAVAAVKAEADPQLLYSNVVASPLLRSIVHTAPVTYTAPVVHTTPVTYTAPVVAAKAVVAPRFHAESAGGVKHTVLKREAEAEADPALLYTNGWATGYTGYPYAATTYGAWGYNPYRRVVALGKREAEADPALLYTNAWGMSPYVYGARPLAYAPYTHAAVAAPLSAAAPAVGTYSNDAAKFTPAYAAKGQYVANSGGAVHVAKREAEAEADPALLYTNGWATGYTGYPYAATTYGAWGYNPYNRVVALGKREAEAEADPALLYRSAWGYAAPSVYTGYTGYPYAASVYGNRFFY
jgi:hypothetical protein